MTTPHVTDIDAVLDVEWFAAHRERTCYAHAHPSGWVLVVKQISEGRDQPPVMLRVWDQYTRVPEDEASCLALCINWPRAAIRSLSRSRLLRCADSMIASR